MSKATLIVFTVIAWIGVVVVMKFHDLVPNASPAEIRPFVAPVWILAVLLTVFLIKRLADKPT